MASVFSLCLNLEEIPGISPTQEPYLAVKSGFKFFFIQCLVYLRMYIFLNLEFFP